MEEILLKDILISLQFYKDGNFMKISRIMFNVALITWLQFIVLNERLLSQLRC